MRPFPVMLQTFFTRRRLKGHLDTQIAQEGHSNGIRAIEGHLGTPAIKAFGHSGTWTLKYLGIWALEAIYLADSYEVG